MNWLTRFWRWLFGKPKPRAAIAPVAVIHQGMSLAAGLPTGEPWPMNWRSREDIFQMNTSEHSRRYNVGFCAGAQECVRRRAQLAKGP